MTSCFCCGSSTMLPATAAKSPNTMSSTSSSFIDRSPVSLLRPGKVPSRVFRVRASAAVDSYGSSPDFIKRMEQAWLISKGSMRCRDCKGTGFRAKWLGEPPIPHPSTG
ncbi:unnamed protein product [Linum tenue]|uniref:Uncharacterized protein n=1 Tax=Linum tenue TaxID=586396 RepID=A0AAV0GUK8_9ROSI|nr:unnamed protein product [Linum tenue]